MVRTITHRFDRAAFHERPDGNSTPESTTRRARREAVAFEGSIETKPGYDRTGVVSLAAVLPGRRTRRGQHDLHHRIANVAAYH